MASLSRVSAHGQRLGACSAPGDRHRTPVILLAAPPLPCHLLFSPDTGSAMTLDTERTTYVIMMVFQRSQGKQAELTFMA